MNKRSEFNDIDFILHKIWAKTILLLSDMKKKRGDNDVEIVINRGSFPHKKVHRFGKKERYEQ